MKAHFIARETRCIDRHTEPKDLKATRHYEEMTISIRLKGSGNTTLLPTPDILTAILKKLEKVLI